MRTPESYMMFPKQPRKKKRRRHKKSIMDTEKDICFLCDRLHNDRSRKQTEEHHILYGAGQRQTSEEEGLKVYLCRGHHKEGPDAAHSNREIREYLCRLAQEEYEKTHTREEWNSKFRKNYLDQP